MSTHRQPVLVCIGMTGKGAGIWCRVQRTVPLPVLAVPLLGIPLPMAFTKCNTEISKTHKDPS